MIVCLYSEKKFSSILLQSSSFNDGGIPLAISIAFRMSLACHDRQESVIKFLLFMSLLFEPRRGVEPLSFLSWLVLVVAEHLLQGLVQTLGDEVLYVAVLLQLEIDVLH